MNTPVTIVITPRDRFSKLAQCIETLYANTDSSLFELVILNLGYPKKDWTQAMDAMEGKSNFRIFDYGMIIPMEAMRKVRSELHTEFAVFLDNDTRVLSGWLPPLIDAARQTQAAIVYPVTLERSGVDVGEDIRNHLFTTEIRSVEVDSEKYLIEHKTFRRARIEELPDQITESQAFELHCVMFRVDSLNMIEIPQMTIREHLDIGMQLRALNQKLYVVPASQVVFDNLGSRARLSDLKYFNVRWNRTITARSSRLFEKRWGYRFYSEPAIYEWAKRRQRFMLMRWFFVPVAAANLIDRIIAGVRRRISPPWDPLSDPFACSELLYDSNLGPAPIQHSHDFT